MWTELHQLDVGSSHWEALGRNPVRMTVTSRRTVAVLSHHRRDRLVPRVRHLSSKLESSIETLYA